MRPLSNQSARTLSPHTDAMAVAGKASATRTMAAVAKYAPRARARRYGDEGCGVTARTGGLKS